MRWLTWLVWRGAESRHTKAVIIGIAVTMRAVVVIAPPYLSSDIYRYVWDGRVTAAGINPYRYVPNDPHLAPLRDAEIFPEINRGNYAHTIYPPAAQAIFFLVTRFGESLTVMKLAMVGFEAVAVALMLRLLAAEGKPAAWIAVYAWNPLPLWEFAGSGHIDAAMIAFVTLALWSRRPFLIGLALAGGVLVKFYPGVLLPAAMAALGLAHAGGVLRGPGRGLCSFCRGGRACLRVPARLCGRGRVCRRRRLLLVEPREIGLAAGRRLEPAVPLPCRMSARRARHLRRLPAARAGSRHKRRGAARRGFHGAADTALSVVFFLARGFRLSPRVAGAGVVDGGKLPALSGPGLATAGLEPAPASH